MADFKILSLDGGGSWALLQVLTLKDIFEKKLNKKGIKGHELLRHFDLVVANSGGSLVLGALACNWTLDEIIEVFDSKKNRKAIFRKLTLGEKYFPNNVLSLMIKSIGTRYSTTSKIKTLKELFKVHKKGVEKNLYDIKMSELPAIIGKDSLQIMVATFDIVARRARVFRSNQDSQAIADTNYGEISLVKAIHGSSNAPVNYFDFPAVFSPEGTRKRYYLLDGALGGFNNPTLLGVTEAIANGVKRSDIKILSLGTASKLTSQVDESNFFSDYYSALIGVKMKRDKNGKIDIDASKPKQGISKFINQIFCKPFIGLGLFQNTLKNLSQSVLFEPQIWANYSAYITLFSDDFNKEKYFIRLSPMIDVDMETNNNLKEKLQKLYQLDMDLTEQKDIDLLKDCFKNWKKGYIKNAPIHWTKKIDGEYVKMIGHNSYQSALDDLDWL